MKTRYAHQKSIHWKIHIIKINFTWMKKIYMIKIFLTEYKLILTEWKYILISWKKRWSNENIFYWIQICFDWMKIYFDIMKKGDIMEICFIKYKIILIEWKYIFISYEFLFLQHFSNHTQWRFIFHLYFSNQIEFHLKSINQELFLKLLKKHCIQYFTLELLIMNWGRCYLRI